MKEVVSVRVLEILRGLMLGDNSCSYLKLWFFFCFGKVIMVIGLWEWEVERVLDLE